MLSSLVYLQNLLYSCFLLIYCLSKPESHYWRPCVDSPQLSLISWNHCCCCCLCCCCCCCCFCACGCFHFSGVYKVVVAVHQFTQGAKLRLAINLDVVFINNSRLEFPRDYLELKMLYFFDDHSSPGQVLLLAWTGCHWPLIGLKYQIDQSFCYWGS